MVDVAAAVCVGRDSEGNVGGDLGCGCRCCVCRCCVCLDLELVRLNLVAHRQDSEEQVSHQLEAPSLCSKTCELCCEPSSLRCCSGCCKCHTCFVIFEICYQIKCEEAGYGYAADALIREAEYGDADYSAHAGGGLAPIPFFSALLAALGRVRQCDDTGTWILAVLEVFMKGFVATSLTPMLPQYHSRRRPRALCLLSYNEFSVLQIQWSSCYASDPLRAIIHVVFAIFVPLGLIRRRRVRVSPMSILRFSGEDICVLSSVMHPLDLQLNPLPRRRLPTRLLVEPLALRLARLQEAPEEYNCRLFATRTSWQAPVVFFGLDNMAFQ